jgi:AraC-like DNA-binding protein
MGDSADFLFKRYADTVSDATLIPYNEQRIKNFDEIMQLLEDSFDERELEIINIKLLAFISSFIYQKEINPSIKENDVVSKSINFMKQNLKARLSVEDFADQQHLSLSHYSRLFRAKTGTSPNHYFNQLKIQKSCQYLYFSDLNIKEICSEVGFDDPYYFSRLFKKLMGMSPAKYKNQHKRN